MYRKNILIIVILYILVFASCQSEEKLQRIDPNDSVENIQDDELKTITENNKHDELQAIVILTEEDYIKHLKGEKSSPLIKREIETTEYFIKPKLAYDDTQAYIHVNNTGYEFCFMPTDEKHAYEMIITISDKIYDEKEDLFEAMLERSSSHVKEDYHYVDDKDFEHYWIVKKIGITDKAATFIHFFYENHLISVLVFKDISENYLDFCNLEKISLK